MNGAAQMRHSAPSTTVTIYLTALTGSPLLAFWLPSSQ